MSNGPRRSSRRKQPYLSPEGRAHPSKYTPDELHRGLVADAVRSHPTDLHWATLAYKRIGKERFGSEGKGAERAFKDVLAEVQQLTGRAEMPK